MMIYPNYEIYFPNCHFQICPKFTKVLVTVKEFGIFVLTDSVTLLFHPTR